MSLCEKLYSLSNIFISLMFLCPFVISCHLVVLSLFGIFVLDIFVLVVVLSVLLVCLLSHFFAHCGSFISLSIIPVSFWLLPDFVSLVPVV